jgi:hypothetical protein
MSQKFLRDEIHRVESEAWRSYNILLQAQQALIDLMKEIQKLKQVIG